MFWNMKKLDENERTFLNECFERSLHLLKENSKEHGIIACAPSAKAVGRHYASIFGRDAAICSMGMVVAGSKDLIRLARKSLITLGKYQAPNGQIPKYVKPEIEEVDFWYYGCIDATLWWLIAINFFDRHVPGSRLAQQLDTRIKLALYWLLCQEHQGLSGTSGALSITAERSKRLGRYHAPLRICPLLKRPLVSCEASL